MSHATSISCLLSFDARPSTCTVALSPVFSPPFWKRDWQRLICQPVSVAFPGDVDWTNMCFEYFIDFASFCRGINRKNKCFKSDQVVPSPRRTTNQTLQNPSSCVQRHKDMVESMGGRMPAIVFGYDLGRYIWFYSEGRPSPPISYPQSGSLSIPRSFQLAHAFECSELKVCT